MRRIYALAALLLLSISFAPDSSAQITRRDVVYQTGVPSGTCSERIVVNRTTGISYNCVGGVWAEVGTVFGGALTFPDGVRQTFNPNATTPGINVGSHAGDPSTPTNGDLWYDSAANELTARINGANVALGAGGGGASYLVYTALLNQSGTSAPVATVLQNTLGGTVVWTRTGTGQYAGTLAGAFTANKTVIFMPSSYGGGIARFNLVFRTSTNEVNIRVLDDGLSLPDGLPETPIEIRVYP